MQCKTANGVTVAVQHQGVLNSLQLLHKMKPLKETTSQKQTSEKGHAHFRDMFPDQCTLAFLFRCWKRLPLSPLVVLQSDWRRGCKHVSLRNCWAHTSVCTHYCAVRLIACGGKKVNPSQSTIGLSWHPFVGNSLQRINHQSGFCSTKMHSSVLSAALALKLFQREYDRSCFLHICSLKLLLLHNENIIQTGVVSRRTSAEPQDGPYEKNFERERIDV